MVYKKLWLLGKQSILYAEVQQPVNCILLGARFEVSTVVKIQDIFWVVMLCNVVTLKTEATCTFETFLSYRNGTWRHNREDLDLSIDT